MRGVSGELLPMKAYEARAGSQAESEAAASMAAIAVTRAGITRRRAYCVQITARAAAASSMRIAA